MKAKSYLDKRTELLPGTRASLFVTDGWRGAEEEGGSGQAAALCMYKPDRMLSETRLLYDFSFLSEHL